MSTHLEVLKDKIARNEGHAYLEELAAPDFAVLNAEIREGNATRERMIVINFLRQKRSEFEEQLKADADNIVLKEKLNETHRRLSELEHTMREHIGRGTTEGLNTLVGSAATTFDSGAPGLVRAANAGILGAIGLGLYGVWRWFHRKTMKTEIVNEGGRQEIVEQKESIPRYLLRITGLLAVGTGLLWLLGRSKTEKDLEAIRKEQEPAPLTPL